MTLKIKFEKNTLFSVCQMNILHFSPTQMPVLKKESYYISLCATSDCGFRTARVENHSYYLDLFPKASNWADKKSIYEVTSERQTLSTHIYLQILLENHNHIVLFICF